MWSRFDSDGLGADQPGLGAVDAAVAGPGVGFATPTDALAPCSEFAPIPLGKMGSAPVANFPMTVANTDARQKASASGPVKDPKDGKDYSSSESFAAEKASLTWTGGELGFFYGHSTGRFGGDEVGSYIMGGVGNEHLQINVGASYQEFNGHVSRSRP